MPLERPPDRFLAKRKMSVQAPLRFPVGLELFRDLGDHVRQSFDEGG